MRTEKVEKEDRNVSIILSSKQGESRDVHSHWRHRRVSGSYGPEYLQHSRTAAGLPGREPPGRVSLGVGAQELRGDGDGSAVRDEQRNDCCVRCVCITSASISPTLLAKELRVGELTLGGQRRQHHKRWRNR